MVGPNFFVLVIFLITKPMGIFMARVFNREKTFLDPLLRPIEKLLYRLTGIDESVRVLELNLDLDVKYPRQIGAITSFATPAWRHSREEAESDNQPTARSRCTSDELGRPQVFSAIG